MITSTHPRSPDPTALLRLQSYLCLRIYAVDSTRVLRTLRCVNEVSRMRLFDPVLAVLSCHWGRISFRDLYADGGSGLGQVRAIVCVCVCVFRVFNVCINSYY